MPAISPENVQRSARRDPWFDNAKMGLVLLVVVGHLLAYLPADGPGGRLYDFVYLWHMPAFVVLTGYLSRSFRVTPTRLWQLATTLLVPYLLFEGLMAWFRLAVGGERLRELWIDPHFPFWYLLAVVMWRLSTPLVRRLGPAPALGLAVAASLGSAFLPDPWTTWLDLPRVLGFWPFFVLGLVATPEALAWLRGRFPALLGVAAFGVIAVLARDLDGWAARSYLYQRPFALTDELAQHGVVHGLLVRLAVLGVGVLGTAAWLSLVPRRDGWFARMGGATLIVYLVHGFVVKGLDYAGVLDRVRDDALAGLAVAVVGGAALALALASPPVRRWLAPVVDPYGRARRGVTEAVELAVVVQQAAPSWDRDLVGAGDGRGGR